MHTYFPKANKFPGLCAFCNTAVDAYAGTYIYVKKEGGGFNRKGRPEGSSHIFCFAHFEEAKHGEIRFDRKGQPISKDNQDNLSDETIEQWFTNNQNLISKHMSMVRQLTLNGYSKETIKEHILKAEKALDEIDAKPIEETKDDDMGNLGGILKRALESHENVEEGNQDNSEGFPSDDAQTLAKMIQKLAGKASVDERQVANIVRNEIEGLTQLLVDVETRMDSKIAAIQTTPPTKLEIKQGNDIKLIDTGLQHEILPDVLVPISQGLHVFLVGPAGSGKTTIGEQIAKAVDKPFYSTGAVDSKYALIGFKDGHGNYQSTVFRKCFEEGGVFLFDEMDASSANALLSFNAALANGHCDFPDGIVTRHPDFVAIAAANTFGHGADRIYVGRNQLDAATLDRFVTVEMGYDAKLERAMCGNDPLAVRWVDYVQRTRKAVTDLQMRYVVSPRASLQGSKLLSAGMDSGKVAKATLYRAMKSEDIAKVQAHTGTFNV